MTGIDSNLEALADKEYKQDEANLAFFEKGVEYAIEQKRYWERQQQEYTDKILEINRRRVTNKQQS